MGKTILPDARVTPRFAGLCTFCRYPRLEDVAPEQSPVDWAIYGVPFDGGVTYRPGARFGPRAIREASQYVKRYHIEHGVDVCDALSIADAGDAPISPYSIPETIESHRNFARAIGDAQSTRLLAVGGDHSIAYTNIQVAWERFGSPKKGLALIHFDSHLDTVDSVWGEKHGHASVFRRAIEDGIVAPDRMLSIGVKGPLNSGDDLKFAAANGVRVLGPDEFRREGVKAAADFLRRVGDEPVYLTFDIDVVDPAFAPGTGTPSIGGFTSGEVLAALRLFKGANLVGADVVEVLPDRDVAGITSLLAAHVIFEILALDAARR
jgi:agmatinase